MGVRSPGDSGQCEGNLTFSYESEVWLGCEF